MPSSRERAHVSANLGEHDFAAVAPSPGTSFRRSMVPRKGVSLASMRAHGRMFLEG